MFERISRGWSLAMTALEILKSDTKLLVFPLLSGISCLLVSASFAVPLFLSQNVQAIFNEGASANQALNNGVYYAILFAFYFCNYFVIVFFNSALIGCVMMRFRGEEPTLGDGFSIAMSRLPMILAWVAGQRHGRNDSAHHRRPIRKSRPDRLQHFGSGLERDDLLRHAGARHGKHRPDRSRETLCVVLKKTWGEAMVANFGTGLVILLFYVLAAIPGVVGVLLGGTMLWIGVAMSVLLFLAVALISSATDTIIIAALYQYATQDEAPKQFDTQTLRGAFAAK